MRERPAALGGEIEWGRAVTDLEQDPRGVTVGIDGRRESTDWVVGCDGAHSRVRAAAGIPFPGVPLGERFLLADVRAPLPLTREAVSRWLDGDPTHPRPRVARSEPASRPVSTAELRACADAVRPLGEVAILTSETAAREALLVRPDGHVAARGSAQDLARRVADVLGTPAAVPAVS